MHNEWKGKKVNSKIVENMLSPKPFTQKSDCRQRKIKKNKNGKTENENEKCSHWNDTQKTHTHTYANTSFFLFPSPSFIIVSCDTTKNENHLSSLCYANVISFLDFIFGSSSLNSVWITFLCVARKMKFFQLKVHGFSSEPDFLIFSYENNYIFVICVFLINKYEDFTKYTQNNKTCDAKKSEWNAWMTFTENGEPRKQKWKRKHYMLDFCHFQKIVDFIRSSVTDNVDKKKKQRKQKQNSQKSKHLGQSWCCVSCVLAMREYRIQWTYFVDTFFFFFFIFISVIRPFFSSQWMFVQW